MAASITCEHHWMPESRFSLMLSPKTKLLIRHWTWVIFLMLPWNSPGKNTGVGSCFLLQGIFPTQGSNAGLLHCRQILYHLSQQRSFLMLQSCLTLCDSMDCTPPGSSVHRILQAGILVWVAMPSSRGFSQPRDWTRVSCSSCISGRFFTAEPQGKPYT